MNPGDVIGCGVWGGGREKQVLEDVKARGAYVRSSVRAGNGRQHAGALCGMGGVTWLKSLGHMTYRQEEEYF